VTTFILPSEFDLLGSKPVGLSEKIVNKVSSKEEVEPDELEPLYTAINPDALNQLFKSQQQSGMVVFPYMGYEVFVTSDGKVDIE
jgi:hypothetical protein